jgi:hypothetical protein
MNSLYICARDRSRPVDLERHAQLHAEHDLVGGVAVAAGIDDVLKIRLNVPAMIEIERVENFSDVLIALHREARLGMGGVPLICQRVDHGAIVVDGVAGGAGVRL